MVLIARTAIRRLAVGALCAAVAQTLAAEAGSIRDGVFTAEQARRGQLAYTGPCDRCHGYKLDGAADDPDMLPAPPVGGAKFLRKWNGRTLAELFDYLRATMPANNPGYLRDDEWADIIAYMLAASSMPAGNEALTPDRDALIRIMIEPSSD